MWPGGLPFFIMVIKLIIGITLAILPFLAYPGLDTRTPKEALAIISCLVVSSLAIYFGKLRPFKNLWLLVFLFFIPVSMFFAPNTNTNIFGADIKDFWVWKPLILACAYALFIITVNSITFTRKELYFTLKIGFISGFMTSLYVILQHLGCDQFFRLTDQAFGVGEHRLMVGGALGNPSVAASFISMLLPLALIIKERLFKYFAVIMLIALLLTKSTISIAALMVTALFYMCCNGKKGIIVALISIQALSLFCFYAYKNMPAVFEDSGRYESWKGTWDDVVKPLPVTSQSEQISLDMLTGKPLPEMFKTDIKLLPLAFLKNVDNEALVKRGAITQEQIERVREAIKIKEKSPNRKSMCFTGYGPGSYYYINPLRHKGMFRQAHNEYVNIFHDLGIVGLVLALLAIIFVFNKNIDFNDMIKGNADKEKMALLSCLLCICITAFGFFPWQLGCTSYYSAFLFGLLHKDELYI